MLYSGERKSDIGSRVNLLFGGGGSSWSWSWVWELWGAKMESFDIRLSDDTSLRIGILMPCFEKHFERGVDSMQI